MKINEKILEEIDWLLRKPFIVGEDVFRRGELVSVSVISIPLVEETEFSDDAIFDEDDAIFDEDHEDSILYNRFKLEDERATKYNVALQVLATDNSRVNTDQLTLKFEDETQKEQLVRFEKDHGWIAGLDAGRTLQLEVVPQWVVPALPGATERILAKKFPEIKAKYGQILIPYNEDTVASRKEETFDKGLATYSVVLGHSKMKWSLGLLSAGAALPDTNRSDPDPEPMTYGRMILSADDEPSGNFLARVFPKNQRLKSWQCRLIMADQYGREKFQDTKRFEFNNTINSYMAQFSVPIPPVGMDYTIDWYLEIDRRELVNIIQRTMLEAEGAQAGEQLHNYLTCPDASVQIQTIEYLEKVGNDEVIPFLELCTQSPNEEVRDKALDVIHKLGHREKVSE